jgi:hypothetical protein
MGSRFVLSIGTMGLALATAFAPRAEAQGRTPITVCRNGARINSEDSHVCDRNGGIDLRASAIARQAAEQRAQNNAQVNNNGDDRYGRTNNGTYNNGTYSNDGRYDNGRYDNDRWDDHDHGRRGNDGRWNGHDNGRRGNGNNGRYSNAPREVFRWEGRVDKEIRIQLQNGNAYVQNIGNREVRNNNGRMMAVMPHQDGILRVERLEGRGDIDVIQQPSASNGYQATLRMRDPSSGAANYRIVAYWQPLYNNGQYGRN